MTSKDKVQFILDLARAGEFGTPENPNRGSSGKANFWNAYFGLHSTHSDEHSIGSDYTEAGRLYREEMDKQG